MKEFAKLFGVMVLAVALTGLVACGGDNNEGTDEGNPDTSEQDVQYPEDTNQPDTNRPDEGGVDTNTPPDDVPEEVCTPVCAPNTCVDDGCGNLCACDENFVCNAGTCEPAVCEPKCDGKECGDDGCKGSCGDCDDGFVCVELTGACEAECNFPDDLPTTWGETGVVNSLHVPANATEKEPCFDYTNDGVGDCGLTGLAGQVNGPLNDMMADGTLAIVFEFDSVTDFANTASFTLKGLMGEPVVEGTLAGDMYVDQASYLEETCTPMIKFADASITAGALMAGPGNFTISVPLDENLLITVHLVDAQIKGDLTAGEIGVAAANGVLSGVVTKQELTDIIDMLDAECDKDPVPASVEDICSYLGVARSAMAMLFDLHQVGDGTYINKDADNPGDAASLCLQFTLAESNVAGYVPAAE